MRKPSLGDQELALLRYIAENAPVTVGEVTESYGVPAGLARSTVKTMMERLQKKGYLAREPGDGVFRYVSVIPKAELLHELVSHFVEKTLAGDFSPFVTYLVNGKDVTDQEFEELEKLVEKLGARRKELEP